jgi:hypothetical protein
LEYVPGDFDANIRTLESASNRLLSPTQFAAAAAAAAAGDAAVAVAVAMDVDASSSSSSSSSSGAASSTKSSISSSSSNEDTLVDPASASSNATAAEEPAGNAFLQRIADANAFKTSCAMNYAYINNYVGNVSRYICSTSMNSAFSPADFLMTCSRQTLTDLYAALNEDSPDDVNMLDTNLIDEIIVLFKKTRKRFSDIEREIGQFCRKHHHKLGKDKRTKTSKKEKRKEERQDGR